MHLCFFCLETFPGRFPGIGDFHFQDVVKVEKMLTIFFSLLCPCHPPPWVLFFFFFFFFWGGFGVPENFPTLFYPQRRIPPAKTFSPDSCCCPAAALFPFPHVSILGTSAPAFSSFPPPHPFFPNNPQTLIQCLLEVPRYGVTSLVILGIGTLQVLFSSP